MTEATDRTFGWIDVSGSSQDVIEAVERQMADSSKGPFVGVLAYSVKDDKDWKRGFKGRALIASLHQDGTSPLGEGAGSEAIRHIFPEAMTEAKRDSTSKWWEMDTTWYPENESSLFLGEDTKSHLVPAELGKIMAQNNLRGRHFPRDTDIHGPRDPDQYGTEINSGAVLHLRGSDGKLTKESQESIEQHVKMFKPRSSVSASSTAQESN